MCVVAAKNCTLITVIPTERVAVEMTLRIFGSFAQNAISS